MKCQNETVTIEMKNGTLLVSNAHARTAHLHTHIPEVLLERTLTTVSQSGTIVHGTIASVAPQMNTALRNVKMTPKGQDTMSLDTVNIRGSSIRYYILPDSLPLDTLLIDDAPKPKNKARKEQADRGGRGGRGRGRGGPRGRGGGRGRGRGF